MVQRAQLRSRLPVIISVEAERDLEAIADYIAEDSPRAALKMIVDLRIRISQIGESPLAFHARPELGRDIRSSAFESYVIFYRATKTKVTIARILHGAMDVTSVESTQTKSKK